MSYYIRFIATEHVTLTLPQIEEGLRFINSKYSINDDILDFEGESYGAIEINHPEDELFQEEISELSEEVRETNAKGKRIVITTLKQATFIVAVQVFFQYRTTEATFSVLEPLWKWLFSQYKGLLQVDGEGYYSQSEQILRIE